MTLQEDDDAGLEIRPGDVLELVPIVDWEHPDSLRWERRGRGGTMGVPHFPLTISWKDEIGEHSERRRVEPQHQPRGAKTEQATGNERFQATSTRCRRRAEATRPELATKTRPRPKVGRGFSDDREETAVSITAEEKQRRREVVDTVRHSSEMEGGRSTDAFREVQEAYVRGEVDIDAVIAAAGDRG